MVQHEMLDEFFEKLEEKEIDEIIINDLKKEFAKDKISKDNLINLINEGVCDG